MRYDQTTGTMLPVSYKYRYADVDLSDRKAYDDFIYETVTGANDKDTDTSDWFQLPKKCNKWNVIDRYMSGYSKTFEKYFYSMGNWHPRLQGATIFAGVFNKASTEGKTTA